MISQRRLQHLRVLAEHAHFGRAAEALRITQPALTKSIQTLETELGVTLIDRRHGSFVPTIFGELVIRRSRRFLSEEEDLRHEVALLAGLDTGSLKVALGPYPSVTSGYPSIARLIGRHPGIRAVAHVAGWREVASQVLARVVDLGIAEFGELEGNEQFATEPVAAHRGQFICRPGHPILDGHPVSLARLLAFPWVATRIPARIAKGLPRSPGVAGSIDPHTGDFVPAIEIEVPMQLAGFVNAGNALALASLAIMERELRSGEVAVVPLKDLPFNARYGFIYLKNRSLTPAALAYMAEVRSIELEFVERETALVAELGL